jgi:translation initiation factor 4G
VEALPVEYRGILVAAFAEAVMQLKADQVSLTRSLFAAVAAKSIVSHAVFIHALTPLMVGVIDIAVDVPSAFNFASLLLLGAGLNRVEVETLAKKMASDEEDEETVEEAKLKMMVAFDKLAE